jgi:hypothetical protein
MLDRAKLANAWVKIVVRESAEDFTDRVLVVCL